MSVGNVEVFLGALNFSSAWTKQVFINGVSVQMKIDTGTDVTAILESIYQKELRSKPRLSKPIQRLWGPDGQELSVQGHFKTQLSTTPVSMSNQSLT